VTTPACELAAHSIATHLQQIYTGFLMLHRDGRIRLRQRIVRDPTLREGPQHLRDAPACRLTVRVNGRVSLCYDVHDSWEIDERRLAEVDFYFKRSYAPERLGTLDPGLRARVRPLGLNYSLFPDGRDRFALGRALRIARGRKRIEEAARALALSDRFAFTPRVRVMSSPPEYSQPPRVIFMTRAFDPHDTADRSRAKVDERDALNDARADLMRALRRELGARFYGGFTHTPHALRRYPDLLVPEPERGSKGGYITHLRSFPIGVATTGIHESIGWKFAEYVAFAKAIVSEPLRYRVAGDLAPGRHYLEFRGVDECLGNVFRLIEDEGLRRALMANNADYYQRYLRPDHLVMNTLATALAP
jgi:hypothetical protein